MASLSSEEYIIMSYVVDNSVDLVRLECVLCGVTHVANVNEGIDFDCPECEGEDTMEVRMEFQNN